MTSINNVLSPEKHSRILMWHQSIMFFHLLPVFTISTYIVSVHITYVYVYNQWKSFSSSNRTYRTFHNIGVEIKLVFSNEHFCIFILYINVDINLNCSYIHISVCHIYINRNVDINLNYSIYPHKCLSYIYRNKEKHVHASNHRLGIYINIQL